MKSIRNEMMNKIRTINPKFDVTDNNVMYSEILSYCKNKIIESKNSPTEKKVNKVMYELLPFFLGFVKQHPTPAWERNRNIQENLNNYVDIYSRRAKIKRLKEKIKQNLIKNKND